jgi:geranylgeranyl diphosphate synthase, type I
VVGNDITEGKRTLMVIHTLQKAKPPQRKRLEDILSAHTKDPKLIQEAIGLLEASGSVEYAQKRASGIIENAWMEAEPHLPECNAKKTVKALIDFSVSRRY